MHWWLAVLAPLWLAPPAPGVPAQLLQLEDQLWLATDQGLYASGPAGWRTVLAEPARDVVADPHEARAWFAAVGGSLYRGSAAGGYERVPLGPGASVHAIAAQGTRVWVATEAGVFAQGASAFERDASLPAGPVQSVRSSSGAALWVARGGALWERADGAFVPRVRDARDDWWELVGVVDIEGGVLLAVPGGLWRVMDGLDPVRIELGTGEIRAIARAGSRLWIAAARGVLSLPLEALDWGAPVLALGVEAFDVIGAGAEVLAATASGVRRLRAEPRATLPLRSKPSSPAPEVLRRAVLAYQRLSPRHIERVERRIRDAAWLPQVRLSGGVDRARSSDRDSDQTFSTGAVRQLFDTSRGADVDFGLDLQLTWDVGKLADPDDAIAVSRERRELIELRDQVLERVNRLYFERERVLAQRDAAAAEARPGLDLRVRELTAALDAWSGGVFSRLDANPHLTPQHFGRTE